MILYHGTNTEFDEFSNDFLCTGIDQYGSGFYFYSVPSKTVLHGGYRVTAEVSIKKSLDVNKLTGFTLEQIEYLLLYAPELDDRLSNYGDIEYEGYDHVLNTAIKSYEGMDYIDGLIAIGNDFYSPQDTHILLNTFVNVTGIDCLVDKSRDIYVILTKKQINILKVTLAEIEDSE